MRVVMLGVVLVMTVAGCTPEGQVNKAKQTTTEELRQEQIRQIERDRVLQEQRQTVPSTR
jgi:hypothetical protein